jgi:hypothetical protein
MVCLIRNLLENILRNNFLVYRARRLQPKIIDFSSESVTFSTLVGLGESATIGCYGVDFYAQQSGYPLGENSEVVTFEGLKNLTEYSCASITNSSNAQWSEMAKFKLKDQSELEHFAVNKFFQSFSLQLSAPMCGSAI